ncbi:MAG: 16S rRNA (cytosine(1402)-N(4))-methyltransferase RsmH [Phycisphaerae bacterium]|nr:16S rRNA (cytosine(1402)-N(4))-methyltransferase RsmH [Phycisphaerae bacterium]
MGRRPGFFGAKKNTRGTVTEQAREHEPVLVAPIVRLLDPQPGQIILDGTVGLGGHAAALLPRIMPGGQYVGLDLDDEMLTAARKNLADATGVRLVQSNYADAIAVLADAGIAQVDHVLLDLGVNSAQLSDSARGFSFDRDGPLDMRFDRRSERRALDLVNALSETELADLFYHYGQEGASRRIAKRICEARRSGRITTTRVLASVVESATGGGGKLHPATRVFMALRLNINQELESLERFLESVTGLLRPAGKLAVIAFQSLEDSIVKRFLRTAKTAGTFRSLTPRPVVADAAERACNPRSRSAKLRVAERLTGAS